MINQSKKHTSIFALVALLHVFCISIKSFAVVDTPYGAFQTVLQAAPAHDSIMREGLAAWWALLPENQLKNRLAQQYEAKYRVSPASVHLSIGSIQDCLDREAEHKTTIAGLTKQRQDLRNNLTNAQMACEQQHASLINTHIAEKDTLNKEISACTDKSNRQSEELKKIQAAIETYQKSLEEEKTTNQGLIKQLQRVVSESSAQQRAATDNKTKHEACLVDAGACQKSLEKEKAANQELVKQLQVVQEESRGHQQTAEQNATNHQACVSDKGTINEQLSDYRKQLEQAQNALVAQKKASDEALDRQREDMLGLCDKDNQKVLAVYAANRVFIEKEADLQNAVTKLEALGIQSTPENMEKRFYATEYARRMLYFAQDAEKKLNDSIKELVPNVENSIRAQAAIDPLLIDKIDLAQKGLLRYYGVDTFNKIAGVLNRNRNHLLANV